MEALIRKHEDFDKSYAAQAEKVNVSTEFSLLLFGSLIFLSDNIHFSECEMFCGFVS